jgi:hypothetical protein
MQISPIKNPNFEKPSRNSSNRTKVKILGKNFFGYLSIRVCSVTAEMFEHRNSGENRRKRSENSKLSHACVPLSPAMGARNQVGIGLSYRPASLFSLATLFQIRFLESIPRPTAGLKLPTQYRPHRLGESIPWNRFLGSLKGYKFGLWCWRCWKWHQLQQLLILVQWVIINPSQCDPSVKTKMILGILLSLVYCMYTVCKGGGVYVIQGLW